MLPQYVTAFERWRSSSDAEKAAIAREEAGLLLEMPFADPVTLLDKPAAPDGRTFGEISDAERYGWSLFMRAMLGALRDRRARIELQHGFGDQKL
jgi:hypothetical protein